MESMEMWEELKQKLMQLPEEERIRVLALLIEVTDLVEKYHK